MTAYEMRISDWSSDVCSSDRVPTDAPCYRIVRELPVLGINGGHYEIELDRVRVPASHLLGARGSGFAIAQQRLGPGRIYHCMRWLGQAQRAFDLLCRRMHARSAFGGKLADKQRSEERRGGEEVFRPCRSRLAPYH